jgi:hypothetical protein
MISLRQWVNSGIKIPIKIKPTAKIEDMKLTHFRPFHFFVFLTQPKFHVKKNFAETS